MIKERQEYDGGWIEHKLYEALRLRNPPEKSKSLASKVWLKILKGVKGNVDA